MRFILAIALLIMITSCEKVIQVNLNDAEKKYVVEAVVTTMPGTCAVYLSQTKNFSEDNTFAGVSGAVVSIKDNGGAPIPLTETSPGVYAPASLTAIVGHTYSLTVSINGQVFTASSTVPPMVPIDSIFVNEENLFGTKHKLVNVQYTDPKGQGNNYRFVQYVNGIKEKTIFLRNDQFTDGNLSLIKLRFDDSDDSDKIVSGDNIQVDMQCIDPAIYEYWYSLSQDATGSSQSASPANPVTNIQGGALGYFSAHTLQRKTMVVP